MTTNCILERVAETKSTNEDLLTRWRAGELIDPVARIAHHQTAGKGRAGRSWIAKPEDSLCFSLAYPFQRAPAALSGLSLLVGLAIISGIAQACKMNETALMDLGLRLKWPNDLLLNGAKLGGILIEGGQAKPGDPTWMIIGVGINLRNAKEFANQLSNAITTKVSALDQLISPNCALPDTEFIWLKLVEALERYLSEFDGEGFGAFQKQWEHWDAYRDQLVSISGGNADTQYGIAKGIDQTGALLLQQENKIISIHAGDVSLRAQS